MSIYRSYFSKSNTLIKDNETNNSQNPVTELSYGTIDAIVSRYIFNIDLDPLRERIEQGYLTQDNIEKHILKLTNTIANRPDLSGGKFVDGKTVRTTSFDIDLFNVDEDWDEGSGYDFIYNDEQYPNIPKGASNWVDRKTGVAWTTEGFYLSGTTQILDTQSFGKGNEDIYIDITDYVNAQLFDGITGFTGTTYGLGLKFSDEIEALTTDDRQAVAFFTNKTNTLFEPHIETVYNDLITDDRHYFYMDKDNDLYLYANVGGNGFENVTVNSVKIYDYNENEIAIITGSGITNVTKGIYKITYSVDSDIYPDSVIFTDTWNITQNGKTKNIDQEFYLLSSDNYYNFDLSSRINFDNYFFNIVGVDALETIRRGDMRRVEINVKELYPKPDNNIPLNVEYRVFSTQTRNVETDVIPFTKASRTIKGYEFLFDTSWLIPQDYYLEIKVSNNGLYKKYTPLRFTITSEG